MTSDSVCVCLTDKFGQRAFVGKVCMDLNVTVPEYKETTEVSIEETERYIHLDLSCGQSLCSTDGGNLCEPGGYTHMSPCGFAPLYAVGLVLKKILHVNTVWEPL